MNTSQLIEKLQELEKKAGRPIEVEVWNAGGMKGGYFNIEDIYKSGNEIELVISEESQIEFRP